MINDKVFKDKVRHLFEFLIKDFGFGEIEPNSDFSSYGIAVRYILCHLFIEIFFIFQDNEVGINFGRTSSRGRSDVEDEYSFHMFLGTVNPTLYYHLGASVANSQEDIFELLEIYSKALKMEGLKILNNEDLIFRKMKITKTTGEGLCPPYYKQPEETKIISKFVET